MIRYRRQAAQIITVITIIEKTAMLGTAHILRKSANVKAQ
jgi:hypothetical protein